MKALLSNGVDINAGDKDNVTALHSAALGGHYEVVDFLLRQGASVKVVDK